MEESREALLLVPDARYPAAVVRAFEAAGNAPEPVRAAVEAAVEAAELDPEGARAALWHLQADWKTLKRLEDQVGAEPTQAALRVGAAIQLVRAELSSPAPQPRRRLPELMEWLSA